MLLCHGHCLAKSVHSAAAAIRWLLLAQAGSAEKQICLFCICRIPTGTVPSPLKVWLNPYACMITHGNIQLQHVLHHVMTPDAMHRISRCELLLSHTACITPCIHSRRHVACITRCVASFTCSMYDSVHWHLTPAWAAQCNPWILFKLVPKSVVFSFLVSFLLPHARPDDPGFQDTALSAQVTAVGSSWSGRALP